jgi:hypothetical protein
VITDAIFTVANIATIGTEHYHIKHFHLMLDLTRLNDCMINFVYHT